MQLIGRKEARARGWKYAGNTWDTPTMLLREAIAQGAVFVERVYNGGNSKAPWVDFYYFPFEEEKNV